MSYSNSYSQRSTEAPMDFSYDQDPAQLANTNTSPFIRKRNASSDQSSTFSFQGSSSSSTSTSTSTSNRNHNFPFLFHAPSALPPQTTDSPEVEMQSVTPTKSDVRQIGQDQDQIEDTTMEAADVSRDAVVVASGSGSGSGSRDMDRVGRNNSIGERKSSQRAVSRVYRKRRGNQERERKRSSRVSRDDDESSITSAEETQDPQSLTSKFMSVQYLLPPGMENLHPPNSAGAIGIGISHLDWPEVLLGYAQFLFNASLLLSFLYLLYLLIRTVQMDIEDKVREYTFELLSENRACATLYSSNHCGTANQAPALESKCNGWERCKIRDVAVVGRARVAAETFAEILNGFGDTVSWRSMLFSLATLCILVGATNSTLSFFRLKSRKQSLKKKKNQDSSNSNSNSNSNSDRIESHSQAQYQTQNQYQQSNGYGYGHPNQYGHGPPFIQHHPNMHAQAHWASTNYQRNSINTPARKRVARNRDKILGSGKADEGGWEDEEALRDESGPGGLGWK